MPSSPTSRTRLEKQATGENLNSWGDRLNQNGLDILDEAIAGVETIALTGDLTLSSANYATDQARNFGLRFTGVGGTVTIPSVEKVYAVRNDCSGTVTIKTSAGAGAVLPAGDAAVVLCDGTNCRFASVTEGRVAALVAAAGLSGSLPAIAGQGGKFLGTDGSAVYWDAVPIPDLGGGGDTTITASTTLTASSAVVQPVNMAAAGQSVTLPDATGLTKGGRKYVITNKGSRTFGVRDSAGTLLAAVAAGGAAELHLDYNSTTAGSWTVTGRGLEPALVAVDATLSSAYTTAVEVACRLTDGLSLHFAQNASGHLFAVAADSSGGTVGTPVAVDVGGSVIMRHCFRLNDAQALACWTRGGIGYASVLTLNGTSVAVGSAASAGADAFLDVTFSGAPRIAQLAPGSFVSIRANTGAISAFALSVSGTTVTIGNVNIINTGAQQALAVYRVSDTTALALYIDDSGTAGTPHSLRGVVLSVSGTTITVGTSAGVNDTITNYAAPSGQLSATSYIVQYRNASDANPRVVHVGVSGTAVTFGTPLNLESASIPELAYTSVNSDRFKPLVYPLSATTALVTYYETVGGLSRHVVVTNSGGALTAGAILFGLWSATNGGNFPQTPQGFLAFSSNANEHAAFAVSINGTALDVTGTLSRGDMALQASAAARFGLSGGVCGIMHRDTGAIRENLMHLARFRANAAPQYLGPLSLNNIALGASAILTPVEVAPNKVALTNQALTQTSATATPIRLLILEFAA